MFNRLTFSKRLIRNSNKLNLKEKHFFVIPRTPHTAYNNTHPAWNEWTNARTYIYKKKRFKCRKWEKKKAKKQNKFFKYLHPIHQRFLLPPFHCRNRNHPNTIQIPWIRRSDIGIILKHKKHHRNRNDDDDEDDDR